MHYYIQQLRHLGLTDYDAYLQTPHWQRKRFAKLLQSGFRCEKCPYLAELEVHHLSYDNLGCEPLTDLIVLCRNCHQREHENVIQAND